MPGKTSDSRAATFTASHGRLVQVEVDAAIARWWNTDAHAAVFAAERDDQDRFNRP